MITKEVIEAREIYKIKGHVAINVDFEEGNLIYEKCAVLSSDKNPEIVMEILEKGYCDCEDGTYYMH